MSYDETIQATIQHKLLLPPVIPNQTMKLSCTKFLSAFSISAKRIVVQEE